MANYFDVKCRCGKNLKSLLETTDNKDEALDYYFVKCPNCNADIRLEITEDFDDDGEWSLYPKLSVFLEMNDDWYSQYTDEFYDLSLQ